MKQGDKLKNHNQTITYQGSIGDIMAFINDCGDSRLFTKSILEELKYKPLTREIPPDGTAVYIPPQMIRAEGVDAAGRNIGVEIGFFRPEWGQQGRKDGHQNAKYHDYRAYGPQGMHARKAAQANPDFPPQ